MQNYLGIDVSKGYADFALLDEFKQPLINNFQLDDTSEGHSKLGEFIRKLFEQNEQLILLSAVESTGGYENNWLNCLQKLQRCYAIKVARLNPKGIHHYYEAKLRCTVTDSISARMIAEYMISHGEVVRFEQQDQMYSLRKQWTLIRMFCKQKTQLLNQLNNLVYQASPELLIYCRNSWPVWLLNLLKRFPTASKLANSTTDQLTEIPYLKADTAEKIIKRAQQSVASATDTVTENMIKTIVEALEQKTKFIESCKKQLISTCSLPDVELVASIPGLGTYSAVGLVIEIGTWLRFSSVKQLAAFFGLHPILKQSGDKTWIPRMSKHGSAEVRAILFMATMVAIQHNPLIRELFARSLAKGKCKMSAIGICMHKLLRIVYGILKSGIPFDAAIDQAYRARKPVQKKSIPSTIRRFQPIDENAPVSARQNKKRKELSRSQDDSVTICEITTTALSRCVT